MTKKKKLENLTNVLMTPDGTFGFPLPKPGEQAPIQFGEICRWNKGNEFFLCTMFNDGSGWARGFLVDDHFVFLLDDQKRKVGSLLHWPSIDKPIATYKDLPVGIQSELKKYRKGVVVGGLSSLTGIHFFDLDHPENYDAFREGRFEDIWSLGTKDMAQRLFLGVTPKDSKYRVLLHTEISWNHWKIYGPFNEEEMKAFVEEVPEKFGTNEPISKGIYPWSEKVNKLEVYKGLKRVDEIHYLKGQGE